MTADELAKLKTLAQKATPGPWVEEAGDVCAPLTNTRHYVCSAGGSDAEFIAAANPQAVLALIVEVEAFRQRQNFDLSRRFEPLTAALPARHRKTVSQYVLNEREAIVSWICEHWPQYDFIGHRIEEGDHLKGGGNAE